MAYELGHVTLGHMTLGLVTLGLVILGPTTFYLMSLGHMTVL